MENLEFEIRVFHQALFNMTREYIRAKEGDECDPKRALFIMDQVLNTVREMTRRSDAIQRLEEVLTPRDEECALPPDVRTKLAQVAGEQLDAVMRKVKGGPPLCAPVSKSEE
jgi:hypothetical protein